MEHTFGTELPQRTHFTWVLVAAGAVMMIPTARTLLRALGSDGADRTAGLAIAAGMVLVLVALPLGLAWHVHRKHVYVSEEALTVTRGEAIRTQIRFSDVDSVRLTRDGSSGVDTPLTRARDSVEILGAGTHGQRVGLRLSEMFLADLGPLMRRLAAEVERRPGILPADQREELTARLR